MSSLQPLREFIRERLSSAAEEIWRHFEGSIAHYEAELDGQRRLLDMCLKPRLQLHDIGFPQVSLAGNVDPCDEERTSGIPQEGCEIPQLKEELTNFSIGLDKQGPVLKQETSSLEVTPAPEEHESSGMDLNIEQVLTLTHDVTDTRGVGKSTSSSNPKRKRSSSNDATDILRPIPDSNLVTKTKSKNKLLSRKRARRITSTEKPFTCSDCGRRFSRKCHLANHLGAHKRGKPSSCIKGERSFSSKAGLDRNLKAHKESKLLSCTKCGQEFNDRSIFQNHVETHKIVKPLCDNPESTSEEESELQTPNNTAFLEQEAFSTREDDNVHDFDSTQFGLVSKPESQNQSSWPSCTSLTDSDVSSEQSENLDTEDQLIDASPVLEPHPDEEDGFVSTFSIAGQSVSTASVPSTTAQEEESASSLSIPAVQRKDNGSRSYSKRHYCLYCKKAYGKISRHLQNLHYNKPDVARVIAFPKGSKERKVLLEHLRNRGNFVHNVEILSAGTGNLVPRKQPRTACRAQDFLHCIYCQGLFRKVFFFRHKAACKLKPSATNNSPETQVKPNCDI